MHGALEIPELVIKILRNADSAADVFNFALSCQPFAEIALEVLWKDWPIPLEGILALLPDNIWALRLAVSGFSNLHHRQRS